MNHALQELYAGQPVICGGKPSIVQFVRDGLVWLAGFASPVRVGQVEAAG